MVTKKCFLLIFIILKINFYFNLKGIKINVNNETKEIQIIKVTECLLKRKTKEEIKEIIKSIIQIEIENDSSLNLVKNTNNIFNMPKEILDILNMQACRGIII
jgi:hypothetical protein